METVAEFVRRTQGPAVPFVPDWYPWVYAHHYLRLETRELPAGLGQGRTSLTETEALDVIQLWCALTGEGIETAARALADAYLRRWGLVRSRDESDGGSGGGEPGATGAGRARRIRQLRRRAPRRGRTGTVASLVPAGRRVDAGS